MIRFITVPLRYFCWDGAPVVFKDVFFAALRTMLKNMTIAQSRYMFKGTTETYHDFCRETNNIPNTIILDDVVAHWIGNENADVVIIYIHGMINCLISKAFC